jgi:hypothetical protein
LLLLEVAVLVVQDKILLVLVVVGQEVIEQVLLYQ